ncbi:SGNH hydrolase [Hypoxylon sp. NC1633]|nr:SGNH hydrolase [Hypoxylon sp. NC1633]
MKLGFAMRPAAIFTHILSSGLVCSLALRQPLPLAPEAQHVIGGGDSSVSGDQTRPLPLPIPLAQQTVPSPVSGFVALGDSYSAGIGTGFEGKEDDCRHGLGAHAQLIATDLLAAHGGRNASAFQFLSCTGATTAQILSGGEDSQVDAFNATLPADFALLSVGGNDLGFFDVINACVFRFYNFYSGTCESALANAKTQIESDDFENRLRVLITEILDKVRWEKRPSFTITVTGYARFFNETTDPCDDMSFGVWWNGPRLKKELRVNMNAMVLTVNAKIRQTVDNINAQFVRDKVLFVDYDALFDGHRFCEDGAVEPDYERTDTWFFLVGGPDNARNGTQQPPPPPPTKETSLPPASVLVDPSSCLEPAQRSGDWGELALCYMAMSRAQDPNLRLAGGDLAALNSMWYVPTYYGKTFHPRSRGHEAMRSKIYEVWRELGVRH